MVFLCDVRIFFSEKSHCGWKSSFLSDAPLGSKDIFQIHKMLGTFGKNVGGKQGCYVRYKKTVGLLNVEVRQIFSVYPFDAPFWEMKVHICGYHC